MQKYVDIIRIDHFRGFVSTWEVDAGESTAVKGHWVKCPGKDFLKHLLDKIDNLKIWVEDLGADLEDTFKLRDYFNFPGMKVMQFAFDSDAKNPYLPHNYIRIVLFIQGLMIITLLVGLLVLLMISTRGLFLIISIPMKILLFGI